MTDWDEATEDIAHLCGCYYDKQEKTKMYRSGIIDDAEIITHDELKKELQDIFDDDKAKAYDRLLPWILHIMDCNDCHKKGTDVCQWTRNHNKKDSEDI